MAARRARLAQEPNGPRPRLADADVALYRFQNLALFVVSAFGARLGALVLAEEMVLPVGTWRLNAAALAKLPAGHNKPLGEAEDIETKSPDGQAHVEERVHERQHPLSVDIGPQSALWLGRGPGGVRSLLDLALDLLLEAKWPERFSR